MFTSELALNRWLHVCKGLERDSSKNNQLVVSEKGIEEVGGVDKEVVNQALREYVSYRVKAVPKKKGHAPLYKGSPNNLIPRRSS